jgi:decaprenylphospho-beta-D-erythro-pentofuranosid-2-ulose 2-reductase
MSTPLRDEGRLPRGHQGHGPRARRLVAERGDQPVPARAATRRSSPAARPTCRPAGAVRRATIGHARCDLGDPGGFAAALDAADEALGGFDTVIVTAGLFATQEQLEADLALTQRLLTVDFANTVVFCEHARGRLLARGGGTLCVFSSVAGERGRKPVVIYGAAKAGLSHYLEGLDHKFRAQGLRTVCVKPGFVKTGMTAGLKPPPFAGEPEAVARDGAAAIDRGQARGLRAGDLGAGDAGHPLAAALRDAQDQVLRRRARHAGPRRERLSPRPSAGCFSTKTCSLDLVPGLPTILSTTLPPLKTRRVGRLWMP